MLAMPRTKVNPEIFPTMEQKLIQRCETEVVADACNASYWRSNVSQVSQSLYEGGHNYRITPWLDVNGPLLLGAAKSSSSHNLPTGAVHQEFRNPGVLHLSIL